MDQSAPTEVLLASAWVALGGDPDLLDLVEVTGQDVGLLSSSSLQALPAMTAAVSASTLAASVLGAARRGTPSSRVRVDAKHVALASRSERYALPDGAGEAALFAPLSRFWRTADGWLRLHANYAWHRERALSVLGCGDRPEDVAEAIGGWRGEDLEDALAAAGGVGFAVRTVQQWREHPQGVAVASLPLLDSTAGSVAGRRSPPGRVAAGLRVLDLTRVIAGPVATRTLAAWGADVLRLDSPHLPEIRAQALDTLSGKRSALLDLSQSAGRTQMEDLLGQADVLVQGYRPGALARYGLSPEELADRHPHLSVVTLSALGTGRTVGATTGLRLPRAVPDRYRLGRRHRRRARCAPSASARPRDWVPGRGRCDAGSRRCATRSTRSLLSALPRPDRTVAAVRRENSPSARVRDPARGLPGIAAGCCSTSACDPPSRPGRQHTARVESLD